MVLVPKIKNWNFLIISIRTDPLYKDVISDLHKGTPVSHVVDILTVDGFVTKIILIK